MTSSHDYVDFDDTIGEYNKMIDMYRDEIKELRRLLSVARRWVGSEPMGNQGCKNVEQIHKDIDQYFLKINDEGLNEQTRTT